MSIILKKFLTKKNSKISFNILFDDSTEALRKIFKNLKKNSKILKH